ncbi:Subtilisin-chymotrypsin inhibitor-2A [Zea mays]|uniref:Subtilisin-chymotrypsin inhibitor-2A n=1 Tax=Zea mays TaxID=4577 RepID=A0A3L6DPS6_MAIZE|nr:Subtilisin-chymotrypsin inhibitor-2A [Zea mays]
MSHSHSTKTSWPEVEGMPAEVAKRKIQEDRPDVQVILVPVDSAVTDDFNTKRVRVFFDKAGNVAQVPKIG